MEPDAKSNDAVHPKCGLTPTRDHWHTQCVICEFHLFPSVPATLLILGLVLEVLGWGVKRSGRYPIPSLLRFTLWAVRPWMVWAAFNLFFRWRGEQGFNDRRTFPFFAGLWDPLASFGARLQQLWHTPSVWLWGGVTLLLLAALIVWLVWVLRAKPVRTVPALMGLYLLTVALHLSLASLPDGAWEKGHDSSLLSSWKAHTSMLYTVPYVNSTYDYFSRFQEIQPKLRATIHGLSHPPVASLSLYWIGRVMGTRGEDIRDPETRLRYSIGLTLFGALNVFLLYGLGRSLFSRETGFLAALLWATAPAVAVYAGFAQDPVYAVFFNLALLLGWHTVMSARRVVPAALGLGATFFALTLLNYSWCLMTTIFALFALVMGVRSRWSLKAYAVRIVLPLGVMTLFGGTFLLAFHLDYWAMYQFSQQYVNCWYLFTGAYQWIMALLGGQMDLFLLLGSVTCSAFVVSLIRLRKTDWLEPRTLLLLMVLGVFALPLLFGPTCLKMETARCWNWVASLPIAFAAAQLLRMKSRLFVIGAAVVSVLTTAGMRLFLTFAP